MRRKRNRKCFGHQRLQIDYSDIPFHSPELRVFFQGKCQVLPANFCEFENSNMFKQARLN